MRDEQSERFESIRTLVDSAQNAIDAMRDLAEEHLREVEHDSPQQAACLQQLQESAGVAVGTLTQAADVARHARSYQAQQHNRQQDPRQIRP